MNIEAKIIRGSGDREAPSITDEMIVSDSMAVARGKRFLDDPDQGAYYTTIRRGLQAIHKSANVYPSKWIQVTDSHLGMENKKLKVLSYTISISKSGVWANMDTEEYLEA